MPVQGHCMGPRDDSNKQLRLQTAPSGPDFLRFALYSETTPAQPPACSCPHPLIPTGTSLGQPLLPLTVPWCLPLRRPKACPRQGPASQHRGPRPPTVDRPSIFGGGERVIDTEILMGYPEGLRWRFPGFFKPEHRAPVFQQPPCRLGSAPARQGVALQPRPAWACSTQNGGVSA